MQAQDSTEMAMKDTTFIQWLPLDTNQVAWFYVKNPQMLHAVNDSILTRFQQYDLTRQQDFDWLQLGNPGSPALPLFFELPERLGFHLGFDAYRLYTRDPGEMKFYRISKSYTNLIFNRGLNQEDNGFSADFSRNFKSRLNLSLQYDRNNSFTDYTNNRNRNNQFNIGLWFTGKKGRYEGFLTYGDLSVTRQENGGITTDTLFEKPASAQRVNIPVWLTAANSRYSSKTLSNHHQFTFKKDPKSSGSALVAFYTIEYGNSTYKYYDKNSVLVPDYYGNFQTDDRGAREYIHLDYLENKAQLQWEIQNKLSADTSRIQIRAGIEHTNFWVNQEPVKQQKQTTFLSGNILMNYRKNILFSAAAYLGILENKGEIKIDPRIEISYPAIGILSVHVEFQINQPSLIEQRNYITQIAVWNNAFKKEKNYGLKGNFQIPKLNVNLFGSWRILDDYIYFDQSRFPKQYSDAIQILQLGGMHHLRLGKLNFDNTVGLQTVNQAAIIHVPGWFSKHSLYLESSLYKNAARIQVGADCRLVDSYLLNGYEPIIGQFYIQNEDIYPVTPVLDVFVNMRVKTFRAFVKLENMLNLFDDSAGFQIAGYPQPDWGIRFGIGWVFIN